MSDYENKMMGGGSYKDIEMKCIEPDCGNDYVFTAGEQQFYKEKGLTNPPKRCPNCRNRRKIERLRNGDH